MRRPHSTGESAHGRIPRTRPSSAGYLLAAAVTAFTLFLALWWILVSGEDEAPWIPAGLGASVVLLVALSAREVVMRRAWTRYLLEQGGEGSSRTARDRKPSSAKPHSSSSLLSASWRNLQKQSERADSGSTPDSHLDVFHLCQDYSASIEGALRANNLPGEKRMALKAGQERVRGLQKHHLLTWARDSSRALTFEAQQRARMSEKIEAANRALHCVESAQKYYPDEPELNESRVAIHEFIASVKVAHWVELAERSAFKGHYRRAIERYKDALFYLNREPMKDEVRIPNAERIGREIELLRARVQEQKNLKSAHNGDKRNGQDNSHGDLSEMP